MKTKTSVISLILLIAAALQCAAVPANPKREFRGAWLHVIGQSQWQNKTPAQQRNYIVDQFDKLEDAGCNAVIFQVRPTADALYESKLEPWSAWLTGKRGKAPSPAWDPMAFAIEEAHRRGMEFHAWLNPYRVTSSAKDVLPASHAANKEPHRFVKFNGQTFFDPAYQENRDFICEVIDDITRRYNVDAIHIDDYFYPYPANGKKFDADQRSYAKFGKGMNKSDWRRHNVDLLIEQIHKTIKSRKPWVRFGVSPFGIWRNKSSDPRGSASSGLQNYDDLYADVLLWVNKGWIDYNVPQIYWEIGHKAADYDKLIRWWSRYAAGRPLIIGQDVERSVKAADLKNPAINQVPEKFRLQRTLPNIDGNCLWYSAAVVRNVGNIANALQNTYQRRPALQPLMPFIDNKAPKKPRKVKAFWMPDGYYLFWTAPKAKNVMDEARFYAIYRFKKGEKVNLSDAEHLIMVTPSTMVKLPYENGKEKYTYVVTSLDRVQNESKAVKKKVKL